MRRWQLSLASDRLKANSWFQGREPVKKEEYRSADERAFDTGVHQLPMTSPMVVRLSDFPDKDEDKSRFKPGNIRNKLFRKSDFHLSWT